MADNTQLPTGSGGDTIRSVDISSVKYQVVILAKIDGTLRDAIDASQLPTALVGGRLDCNTGGWFGSVAPTVGSKTSANSIPVVIASDQGAVPVSGTVTANVGATGGLALDATLTGGTAKAITRGGAKGATAAADVTSTADGADHQALDVTVRLALPTGGNVIGGVTQSGTWTVALGAGAATIGKVDQGTGGASAWKVDGSAVTQPVSGTFWQATQPVSGTFWQATQPISAAALPLPSGAATSANQATEIASLASIDGKIPASPATDRTTVGSPFSTRLTDGTSFYDARSIRALTASDVVAAQQSGAWTVAQGTPGATAWPVSLADADGHTAGVVVDDVDQSDPRLRIYALRVRDLKLDEKMGEMLTLLREIRDLLSREDDPS